MPKERISREMIEAAAFALAREGGMERVQVKRVAERLKCSAQPIYSHFENMEALRRAVEAKARDFVGAFVGARVDAADPFRSTGLAYVQLAREEPELFRIFILQERPGVDSLAALYRREASGEMAERIARRFGIDRERAAALHLNMLIYNIGLGALFCSAREGISLDEIAAQQEIACAAFLNQARDGN